MTDFNYRFSIIPAGAITDRRLEPRDLQVLCLLGRHTKDEGWCYRSQVKMAREIDCSRSSVQRSVDRLCDTGWLEKRLRTIGDAVPDAKHPHASYAYRPIFDRKVETLSPDDDPTPEQGDEEGCPPVGTPVENTGGVPTGGHPGAHHTWAGGAHTYVGTNKEESKGPLLEEVERESRARTKGQKKRDALKALWPTGAIDDQAKIDREWEVLPNSEHEPAIELAPVFLAEAKKNGRKYVPPLWKYLEQRNWKHLKPAPKANENKTVGVAQHPAGSPAARALLTLGRIARYRPLQFAGGNVVFRGEVTPALLALADAPPETQWGCRYERGSPNLAAWRDMIYRVFAGCSLPEITTIDAPWPWPPRKDGSIITSSTDPPGELSDEDARALLTGT